ncbi:MAG: transketolase C-terminal domain-containing protein, partial [Anaerolineales bacterium]|nr:transketolase C-terminal domain-containing protein [Anaerolineales bacterium]
GAYVLADFGDKEPDLILMGSGSEVPLVLDAAIRLAAEAIAVRVVSFPSWELFAMQDEAYRQSVLPSYIHKRLAVEAGVTLGWERWVGERGAVIGVSTFGASAPYQEIYRHYGLTVERIVARALDMMRSSW